MRPNKVFPTGVSERVDFEDAEDVLATILSGAVRSRRQSTNLKMGFASLTPAKALSQEKTLAIMTCPDQK